MTANELSTASAPSPTLKLTKADLSIDQAAYRRLLNRLLAAARRSHALALELDSLPRPGMEQLAVLARLGADARSHGVEFSVRGLSAELQSSFALACDALSSYEHAAQPNEPLLERVGDKALLAAHDITSLRTFVASSLGAVFVDPFKGRPWRFAAVIEQLDIIGVRGVGILIFISLLVGTVLALNGAEELRQFGASIFIANLIGISMVREMGPLMTAILVAGRSGSAIAAELGTMVVGEEIDALQTMAMPPARFLLAPRIIALLIGMPCLAILADLFGIIGGYLVGTAALNLGSANYISQTQQALRASDILTGLAKAEIFAMLIGLISCYEGITVSGGAQGVGAATTRAVVNSIIAAIAADAIFTMFFYFTG